jgi:hypothetical protein
MVHFRPHGLVKSLKYPGGTKHSAHYKSLELKGQNKLWISIDGVKNRYAVCKLFF